MRTSASNIKGAGKGHAPLQEAPREGSKLREIYDHALTGRWFTVTQDDAKQRKSIYSMLDQLRMFYNLEFVIQKRYGKFSLFRGAGVWSGGELHSIPEVEEAIEHTIKGA
jgi:hypothetical protein